MITKPIPLTVTVTEECIEKGIISCESCPIAIATKQALIESGLAGTHYRYPWLPSFPFSAHVGNQGTIVVLCNNIRYKADLPQIAQDFIFRFDRKRDKKLKEKIKTFRFGLLLYHYAK